MCWSCTDGDCNRQSDAQQHGSAPEGRLIIAQHKPIGAVLGSMGLPYFFSFAPFKGRLADPLPHDFSRPSGTTDGGIAARKPTTALSGATNIAPFWGPQRIGGGGRCRIRHPRQAGGYVAHCFRARHARLPAVCVTCAHLDRRGGGLLAAAPSGATGEAVPL